MPRPSLRPIDRGAPASVVAGKFGGLSRFAAALDKTRERAVNKSRANPEDEFDLRECLR